MPEFKHEGFENLPADEDTKILSSKRVEVEGLAAIHESWSWDGTLGETLIFREKDLGDRSDDELRSIAVAAGFFRADARTTISRNRDGFALVNFNFRT